MREYEFTLTIRAGSNADAMAAFDRIQELIRQDGELHGKAVLTGGASLPPGTDGVAEGDHGRVP